MTDSNVGRDVILNACAPCAFCCYTCAAMKGGVIEQTSEKLSHYLEEYYDFTMKNMPFKYRAYRKRIKIFTEQLESMKARKCGGCRSGADERCCIPDCFVAECAKSKNVDFCGECDEFPCSRGTEFFRGTTLEKWKSNNELIKSEGVQSYYTYAVSRSHYHFYRR